jgi:hypothetical protein
MKFLDKLKLIPLVALARSSLDYAITQTAFLCSPLALERTGLWGRITRWGYHIVSTYPYVGKGYFVFLQLFGFFAAAVHGLRKRSFKDFVDALPFAGLGTFLAENIYYLWVNLFGNLNGCYNWYTGNPLNPDGHYGYSWTNPANMPTYFLQTMALYLGAWLVLKGGIYLYERFLKRLSIF